jgi:hypothetical protein
MFFLFFDREIIIWALGRASLVVLERRCLLARCYLLYSWNSEFSVRLQDVIPSAGLMNLM